MTWKDKSDGQGLKSQVRREEKLSLGHLKMCLI